ncbi:MAG: LPS-assembly protein LptD, partial [Bacteroidales bacterium]|nr:LPS-assembly protein LptD [Bacteroidales bacterium]
GKPVLEYGGDKFESDTLKYNFNTKRAVVKNIVTQQDEGLLHSSVAKMLEDGSSNVYKSTYSTCDLDTPHFYIDLRKAKIYPGKKIVSGPANLVFEGIPTPLWLPFGFFPIQNKKAESGIILPRYNYEENRGLALTDGGFYIAASEYYDLTLQGSIYTNGTWLASISTNYNKRYKYRGSLAFSYANNISGHKGLDDYSKSNNYSFKWSYSQDAKARPGSSFSANVNMSSSGYDKNNSYNVQEHITTTKTSSISYSKKWSGTPFNFTASMNHNQNSANKTVAMSLPTMSLSASRIYPFKNKNRVGPSKWYEEISLQYTANLSNQINTYDSLMFTSHMFDNMRFGFQHQVPLSLQITPFKNFSITPSLTYKGVMYLEKIEKTWSEDAGYVMIDTISGLFYGQALNPSVSVGYTPQIFGLFQYKNPNWRLQAIRHVIKPSVTFGYIPYIKQFSSDMYKEVQYNSSGDIMKYSIFEGGIYGTPNLSRKSAVVNFNINNVLEAKVKSPSDTTGKASTIKLIDNLSLSTSYDIFADSLRWSPVNMSFRTTVAQKISISATSRFSLYGLDSLGNTINKFQYSMNKRPMRLTNTSLSVGFSLSDLIKQFSNKNSSLSTTESRSNEVDEDGYLKFSMPWSMSVNYSFTYSKPRFDAIISQTISVNGSVSLTHNTSISYRSGYDITNRKLSATQLSINRTLHCWTMSMSWIPVGNLKSWSFLIRVNASMLSDLKYERKKDYHDNY